MAAAALREAAASAIQYRNGAVLVGGTDRKGALFATAKRAVAGGLGITTWVTTSSARSTVFR